MEKNIIGFGEEYPQINYSGIFDWFVAYQDPISYWNAHPTCVLMELAHILGMVVFIIHAFKTGGRWPWLLLIYFIYGVIVELVCLLPFVQNFQNTQGILTFVGRRLPLYVFFYYPVLYYPASWAVSKIKFQNAFTEYIVSAFISVLIDVPFEFIGVKFVHFIYHDTDENIYDRTYFVPWISYFSQYWFSIGLQIWFHYGRTLLDKRRNLDKWECSSLKTEAIASLLTLTLSMPTAVILLNIFHSLLHDFYGISCVVTASCTIMLSLAIAWALDRKSDEKQNQEKLDFGSIMMLIFLASHFALHLVFIIFFNPEDAISIGIHQRIGNCDDPELVPSLFADVKRNKFLCVDNYDEKYYDFHCLPNERLPKNGSIWYTICGTPFENRVEYFTVLSVVTLILFAILSPIYITFQNSCAKQELKANKLKQKVK